METKGMKILVVEDNPGDLHLLEETLRKHGGGDFKLVHEDSLQNALQQLSKEEIDAILLDLSLPGTSGLETLARIHEADSITPIIVWTGSNDEAMALQALRMGAQDYLVKDKLDGGSLIRTLRYSVERNRYGLLRKLEPMEDELNRSLNVLTRWEAEKKPEETPGGTAEMKAAKSYVDINDLDFAEILEKGKVEAHFQPWVSLNKKSVVGFEGLCRGVESLSGKLISPLTLLRLAGRRKVLNSLDRLFRKKVMESFQPFAKSNPDLVLSVNFATSTLDDNEENLNDFISLVREYHLDPGHVAIEILESRVHDIYRLKHFIESQKAMGFLIALDDIGSGYSNLNRIAELKPDLIKTDRSLIMGIDQNYHQQEVFKSMVKLAHSIGALVIAEGAETEMEAMCALELGSDMIQGFYFSEPEEMSEGLLTGCEEKIDEASKKFKSYVLKNINVKRSHYREYDQMIYHMARELASATPKSYDTRLLEIIHQHPQVECLFILDEGGTQMSRMVGNGSYSPREMALFKASQRGADHSLKDYYYYLIESDLKEYTFVTEPYLSLATGNLCVTISTLFKDAYGHTNLLCANVKPEHLPVRFEAD